MQTLHLTLLYIAFKLENILPEIQSCDNLLHNKFLFTVSYVFLKSIKHVNVDFLYSLRVSIKLVSVDRWSVVLLFFLNPF